MWRHCQQQDDHKLPKQHFLVLAYPKLLSGILVTNKNWPRWILWPASNVSRLAKPVDIFSVSLGAAVRLFSAHNSWTAYICTLMTKHLRPLSLSWMWCWIPHRGQVFTHDLFGARACEFQRFWFSGGMLCAVCLWIMLIAECSYNAHAF